MRNLKKVLSLSLALVMLLGLMVVGAGAATTFADLKDKDEISENYAEAVDLLTALGVIEGNENDEFMPTGTLTREAAAKIVAYLALGVDAAEKLTVTSAPFKDVAANRWSAGYIAYCANVGIIDGDGKGSFYPTQEVTGYQFAKMLLGVLGYGAKDEYVGSNWALNVATDGVTVGLFDRLSNVGNTSATREEAAQLAYNALTTDMVTYSELFGTYSKYANGILGGDDATLLGTKADKIFGAEVREVVDDLGYTYEYWKYQGKTAAITDTYLTDVVLGTVTSGTGGAMYRAYDFADSVEIWENGVKITGSYTLGAIALDRNSDGTYDLSVLSGKTAKPITYNGQKIDVIDSDNDGEADKLIVVTEYLAKVTKVTAETASAARSVTLTVYIPGHAAITGVTLETEDYEKDDYVLVVPFGTVGTVASYTAASSFSILDDAAPEVVSGGTVTAYSANNSVTTGGVKYSYNGVFTYVSGGTNFGLGVDLVSGADLYSMNNGTYNFYLDSNGYVIGVEVVEDSISDYAYITAASDGSWSTLSQVKAILSDGTVGTYTVASASGYDYDSFSNEQAGSTTDINNIGSSSIGSTVGTNALLGRLYSYSINSNNEIVLNAMSGKYYNKAATSTTLSFTNGYTAMQIGGTGDYYYATSDTVFIYRNGNSVYRYVGYENAPSTTSLSGNYTVSLAYRQANSTAAKYVQCVVIDGVSPVNTSENTLYVVAANNGSTVNNNGDRVYTHKVVLDGEVVTIVSANRATTGNIYTYTVDADAYNGSAADSYEAGQYTLSSTNVGNVSSGAADASATAVTAYNSGVIYLGAGNTNAYIVNNDTAIVDVSNKNNVDTSAAVEVGDKVLVTYNTTNNIKYATAVYIVENVDGTSGGSTGPTVTTTGMTEGVTVNFASKTIAVNDRVGVESSAEEQVRTALTGYGYTVNSVAISGTSGIAYATAPNGVAETFTVSVTNLYAVTLTLTDNNAAADLSVKLGNTELASGSIIYVDSTTGVGLTVTATGSVSTSHTGGANVTGVSSPYTVTATAAGTVTITAAA